MRGSALVDDEESEFTPVSSDLDRPTASNAVLAVLEAEKSKESNTMDVEDRSIVANTTLKDVMDTSDDAVLHPNCPTEPVVGYAFDGE